jgi:hypothetical protein
MTTILFFKYNLPEPEHRYEIEIRVSDKNGTIAITRHKITKTMFGFLTQELTLCTMPQGSYCKISSEEE